MNCYHNRLDVHVKQCISSRSTAFSRIQWHHVKVLFKVRNHLDQTASVILIQATPGWLRDTWHHIWAPTSASTPMTAPTELIFFRLMALFLAWSSQVDIRTSRSKQPQPSDKPRNPNLEKFTNLNEFW